VCLLFGELKATTAEKKKYRVIQDYTFKTSFKLVFFNHHRCITSKVMDMQEYRASLMKENQASLQKHEKPSNETEDLKTHFAEVL
jgi:hypothetical protein